MRINQLRDRNRIHEINRNQEITINQLRDENTRINETNRNQEITINQLRDENNRINEINRNQEITINQLKKEIEEIKQNSLDNKISLEENKKKLNAQLLILNQQIEEQKINSEKFEKQFSTRYDLEKAENFYDIIVGIDSIKNIEKGWKIRFSEIGNQLYKKNEGNECIKIGVVGNGNKGKSFLLNKLSNFDLPSSTTIRTEGLSLKYPDLQKKKIKILFF